MDTREARNGVIGQGQGFERIRRITGYLVGGMDKWNDAKRAEEADRVKHGHHPRSCAEAKDEELSA